MKKSFFTIASLAMVLALVGCSGSQNPGKSGSQGSEGSQPASTSSDSGSSSQGGGDVEVPVTEGKVTVYFTADFDGVELASYAAINLAGGFTSWNTGHPEETEMTNLEGTNVYYKQVDAPAAGTIYYKIILGYNTSSQYPDDQLGVNWTNEATGYPDGDDFGPGEHNKTIEFAGTEQKVDLGGYTWKTMLPQPVLNYHDATMYVDFYEEIPAGHHVYIMGGFNSWSATEMTKDTTAEGVRYQTTFEHLLEKEYEFKIKVHPTAKDAEGFNVWNGGFEVNTANAKVAVNALFDRGPRNVYGTDVKRFPVNQLDGVMEAVKDDEVEFTGVICAMHKDMNKNGIWVADRGQAVEVYPKSANVEGLAIGDTVHVQGKIDVYNKIKEVISDETNTLIEKVADHGQEVHFQQFTREMLAGLDEDKDLNMPVQLKGKVTAKTTGTTRAGANTLTVTVEFAAAKEAEGENPALEAAIANIFVNDSFDLACFNALSALQEGDTIEVKGVLAVYSGVFQVAAPIIIPAAE